MSGSSRRLLASLMATLAVLAFARPAAAHVEYVTEGDDDPIDAVRFAVDVLSEPFNAALVAGGGVAVLGVVGAYLAVRPTIRDVEVLATTLEGYEDLVPWMLRLSLGLPILGAGFAGYWFAPPVAFDPVANPALRIVLIGIGFFLLAGLATRFVAALGAGLYLATLAFYPEAILAMEYLPGFVAIFVLGAGRPSGDHILRSVASTGGTVYGRIDPVHHVEAWLEERTERLLPYVPVVLRVGLGVTFVYLGLTQKLANPGQSLLVVEQYDLTSVVPVDPGLWVLGAGLVEMAVGVALILGFFTRATAAVAFVMLTLTLFGLPDDPVLAHVTLFGMSSALFTLGGGPASIDSYLSREGGRTRTIDRSG